jgi:hypothetical protein
MHVDLRYHDRVKYMANTASTTLIRGLDKRLYKRLVGKAKEGDKNVADLVNEAMRGYVRQMENAIAEDVDPNSIVISGGSVTLSKNDIIGIHQEVGTFSIENSGQLIFDKDIDREAFQYIERIHNTGRLRVPKDVYHLILLKSGRVNGIIEKY